MVDIFCVDHDQALWSQSVTLKVQIHLQLTEKENFPGIFQREAKISLLLLAQ
jgi:hypothetical protein